MRLSITGVDLERTDDELRNEFDQFLAAKRTNPPKKGKARAAWHDAVREILSNNQDVRTPREVVEQLLASGSAVDISSGITDQKIQIGGVVVLWDTFQAYCYRFRKTQQ